MKDYKKILKGVINIINTTEKSDIGFVNICTYISENCSELKMSDDERIRKELIFYLGDMPEDTELRNGVTNRDVLAWLERQNNNNTNKVEQKPNYCHHKVNLSNCSEEYRKAYYDGWNNCNMQYAQLEEEQKSNPYSGVSFEYNGHTWGMCARDGGVDISYDKQLIANINPIQEKDEFDNLSKPIDNKEIGCNAGDFIMLKAPNHGI